MTTISNTSERNAFFPTSFKDAKQNISINLQFLLTKHCYSPATFALNLNTICGDNSVTINDVYEWLKGTTLPNLYHLYKISYWFNIPMDVLFMNNLNADTFCRYTSTAPAASSDVAKLIPSDSSKENLMSVTASNITITRSAKKEMESVVLSRTTSNQYNLLLANKIYSSNMQLKTIATKVGASTRSLRDYALYGTSVPADVANKLVKIFKTSYHNLGLRYNKDTNRYEHLSVKVKA